MPPPPRYGYWHQPRWDDHYHAWYDGRRWYRNGVWYNSPGGIYFGFSFGADAGPAIPAIPMTARREKQRAAMLFVPLPFGFPAHARYRWAPCATAPPLRSIPTATAFKNEGKLVMEYRLLGRSGLKISTITMGTMTFGRAKDGVAR